MAIGKIEVQMNCDAKKIIDVIETIAVILRPYDLSDKDINSISDLLRSCLKTERKELR